MAVLNKQTLVDYMITKHREKFGENISPIKLQKGLYFLFAFWGGEVQKQKNDLSEDYEIELGKYDAHLFDSEFEAWAYGPVDRKVYVNYKEMTEEDKNQIVCESLDTDKVVNDFVDNLLERIFISNDFGLVDLSHEDDSWKEVFDRNHKKPMCSNDIIKEYATR